MSGSPRRPSWRRPRWLLGALVLQPPRDRAREPATAPLWPTPCLAFVTHSAYLGTNSEQVFPEGPPVPGRGQAPGVECERQSHHPGSHGAATPAAEVEAKPTGDKCRAVSQLRNGRRGGAWLPGEQRGHRGRPAEGWRAAEEEQRFGADLAQPRPWDAVRTVAAGTVSRPPWNPTPLSIDLGHGLLELGLRLSRCRRPSPHASPFRAGSPCPGKPWFQGTPATAAGKRSAGLLPDPHPQSIVHEREASGSEGSILHTGSSCGGFIPYPNL